MRIIWLLLLSSLFACSSKTDTKDFYLPTLIKSYELIEFTSNRSFDNLRMHYLEDEVKMEPFFVQAKLLKAKDLSLQKAINELLDSNANNDALTKFRLAEDELNAELKKTYNVYNYAYEESLVFPDKLVLPIDSAEYWLMKLEAKRILNVAYGSLMSNFCVADWTPFFTDDVYLFAPGMDTVRMGNKYVAQVTLGSIDTTGKSVQRLHSVKLWRNGSLQNAGSVDTNTLWGSMRELTITPKDIGEYKYQVTYTYLKPNGYFDTIIKSNNFIVK